MQEEGWPEAFETTEVEVRSPSPLGVAAAVLCWVALLVGALFLPLRSALTGLLLRQALLGFPPSADTIAESDRHLVLAAASASVTAAVLLVIALVFRTRERDLISAWVTFATSAGAALLMWVLLAVIGGGV